MKTCVLLIAAALVSAQAPPPVAPETVVAAFSDGSKLTLGDLRKLIEQDPRFMQAFQQDATRALKEVSMVMYTAAQGEKLKLADESPWKEQIEMVRKQVLSSAMFNHERNHYPVTEESIEAYYKANQARYEQVEIKIIKLSFLPGKPAGKLSVEEEARRAFEIAHAGTDRPEAETRALAADIVKKLREGADFAKLVEKYSDDQESKSSGGDFGAVKPTSPYADNFKKAVLALKPGEVSEPIQSGNSLYIARAEKKSVQPLDQVRLQIVDDIKDAHLREYLAELEKRFAPTILRPDVVAQLNANAPKPTAAK